MIGLRLLGGLALALMVAGCATPSVATQQEGWQAHTDAGMAAARQGRHEEAEREFMAAVEAIKTVNGNEGRVMASLSHLAALYMSAQRPEAAESVLAKAVDFAEKTVGLADPDAVMVLRNLGGLQMSMKKFAAAEATFRKIPDGEEQIGEALIAQGKVAEAEEAFTRAAASWEKKLGPAHPDLAARLDRMARVCSSHRAWEPAAALLTRAIESSEKAFGPKHPNVAAVAQNLAGVREEQGREEEAAALYSRALAIWEETGNRDNALTCEERLKKIGAGAGR